LIFPALENTKHTKPVLLVYTRQFIINLKNKSKSQRNYIEKKLVNNINIVLKIKDVTKVYRLLNKSVLITLLEIEEKTK
jgi:hypothetical protein